MTDYFTTKETFGRTEKILDVQRFTRDLAKAMGGAYKAPKPDDMGVGERYATFDLDGFTIGITRSWQDRLADKVTVNIDPADVKLTYNDTPRGDDYKLPRASLSAGKPMARIVADIRRRVIEPAKAPTEKRRAYAADLKAKANNLAARADTFRKNPRLDVRVENGATHSGTIFNREGVYLNARFYADGTVGIDRLGTISADQFEAILAVLYSKEE
jgi:hypothetical protein